MPVCRWPMNGETDTPACMGGGCLPVCVLIANHLLGARRTQLNTIPPCTCGATATITVMVTANE